MAFRILGDLARRRNHRIAYRGFHRGGDPGRDHASVEEGVNKVTEKAERGAPAASSSRQRGSCVEMNDSSACSCQISDETLVYTSLYMVRRSPATSTDEHLDHIASLLDDMFRVPGTQIRFGLDFLIGWIPGVGDAVAGLASLVIIIISAWRRGAALVTLARMITNVVLETLLGAIPVVGDAFHVVWKSNRRNYRLLMREKKSKLGENHAWRDVLFFVLLLLGVLCLVAVPLGLVLWLTRSQRLF
jgi:hypothetical protein